MKKLALVLAVVMVLSLSLIHIYAFVDKGAVHAL